MTGTQIDILENAASKLRLSARAQHRIMKVARTIADMDESRGIKDAHLIEAMIYRTL